MYRSISKVDNLLHMAIQVIAKNQQAEGSFNNGAIIENKPIGFPNEGGRVSTYSNLFYWANAEALEDSTIGLHPHKGFEIMSLVLKGSIKHYDTLIDEWVTLDEGDLQVIRSGSGIQHSEHLEAGSRIFQIWLDPDLRKSLATAPSYDDYNADEFITEDFQGFEVRKLIGGPCEVELHSEVTLEDWKIREYGEHSIALDPNATYSAYIIEGLFSLDQWRAGKDDFCIIKNQNQLTLKGSGRMIILKNPTQISYNTYGQRLNQSQVA